MLSANLSPPPIPDSLAAQDPGASLIPKTFPSEGITRDWGLRDLYPVQLEPKPPAKSRPTWPLSSGTFALGKFHLSSGPAVPSPRKPLKPAPFQAQLHVQPVAPPTHLNWFFRTSLCWFCEPSSVIQHQLF